MTIDIDKERADFSVWAKSENFNTNWHSIAKFFTSMDTQVRWEVWQAARASIPQAPTEGEQAAIDEQDPAHFYAFAKPKGWINLLNPGQSWEEWTKTQGIPTASGWKVFGTWAATAMNDKP
jgi:hypothetical protein